MPTRRRAALLAALLAAPLGIAACGPEVYEAHGQVREVHRDEGRVEIAHEAIPGWMEAMTMSFDVPDAALLAELREGMVVDFRIEYDGRRARLVAFRAADPGPP